MEILIRKMEPGDYDMIIKLWEQVPGMGLNDLDDSRDGILRMLQRNPGTCFVAEDSGEIIATIMVGTDGRRGHIYHLAVREAYRGKGTAKRMLDAAEEAVRRLGISKIFLVALKSNPEGNDFWEHIDYTVREDIVYRDRVLADMKEIFT